MTGSGSGHCHGTTACEAVSFESISSDYISTSCRECGEETPMFASLRYRWKALTVCLVVANDTAVPSTSDDHLFPLAVLRTIMMCRTDGKN